MKSKRIPSLLVATALYPLLGPLLVAQSEPAKKPADVQAKEASIKPAQIHELSFSVVGLTKDNLSKVKEGLQGLMTRQFVCAPCKVEQATAGTCPKCKGELAAESHPTFDKVQPSEAGTVALTIAPKATLRLSELESTLGKSGVKIDAEHFPIEGHVRLLVRGVKADAAPAVEKALLDAKLFQEAKARFDTATNELVVTVQAGSMAPMRAKVAATIEGAKGQLADVIWAPMALKS